MYKYYKELEDRTSFKTIFTPAYFGRSETLQVPNCSILPEVIAAYQNVCQDLLTIDLLIKSCNEDNLQKQGVLINPELRDAYYSMMSYQEENAWAIDSFKDNMCPTLTDLKCYLQDYLTYVNCLIIIYPHHKTFLIDLQRKLNQLIRLINETQIILLPKEEDTFEYTWPNSWYITPNGYLYNSGGPNAHKEGNLVYAYGNISSNLTKHEYAFQVLSTQKGRSGTVYASHSIPDCNNFSKIKAIKERGYITHEEFVYYTNMMYYFPQIVINENGETNNDRSYQNNLITLILGYMAAESCFYSSFKRLSKASDPKSHFYKINQLTAYDIDDMLIRFCGFHKISRVRDNTISTSAIDAVSLFKEYLDNGWTVDIVPPIVYDAYLDQVDELDLHSQYVKKHLDKALEEYQGKGRVLIKR